MSLSNSTLYRQEDLDYESDAVVIGREDVGDFNPGNILPLPQDIISDIQTWLDPTEYNHEGSEYQKHLSSHLEGTGKWVVSTIVYQQWHESLDDGILWIQGIPGSGKSVLAATLIYHLSQEGFPVLYFFFRHTIVANCRPEAALRDWLAQILKFSPPVQLQLQKDAAKGVEVEKLSLADLYGYLHIAMSHLPKVYCIVDALDEMDSESLEPFLHILEELSRWRPFEIKVIMTSRPIAVIQKIMRSVKVLDVRLEKQRVESDIIAYIKHRLSSSSISRDSHSFITDSVKNRANGLFLYAKLAMDNILEQAHPDLETIVQAMPADLSIMYTNLLEEHSRKSGIPTDLQELVLQCVTHTTRPLRLLELADLINVSQQDNQDLGKTKNLIRSICGPLLEILLDETVHVVHHSLTEFLNGTTRNTGSNGYSIFEFGPTHNRLALLCLLYLLSGSLKQVEIVKPSYPHEDCHLRPHQVLPPFVRYAVSNWHIHVQKAISFSQNQSEVNVMLHNLFIGENMEKLALLTEIDRSCGLTPLGFATAFRLESFAREVLDLSKQADSTQKQPIEIPFRYAAANGYVALVKLLLEYGADPNQYGEFGFSALHSAVRREHHDVAKLLLDAGVDPFLKMGQDRSSMDNSFRGRPASPPAQWAFSGNDIQMALIFLPYLKTPRSVNQALNWAVEHSAVEHSNVSMVEQILQHPMVEINTITDCCTVLYTACADRDANMISLLLKAGADPNIIHNEYGRGHVGGYNVLHSLSGRGYPFGFNRTREVDEEETKRCFKLVLDAGAKMDQVDIKKRTPLHVARDVAAVCCLLDAGADPNAANQWGETLMDLTTDDEILKLLMSRVNINLNKTWKGLTPLMSLFTHRFGGRGPKFEKAVRLVELGADVTAVDNNGNGILHHIVGLQDLGDAGISFIRKLLSHGADINLRNNLGQTVLHKAGPGVEGTMKLSQQFDMKIIEALVASGADLGIKDNKGQTPLFQMLASWSLIREKKCIEICEKIMALGARIDITNSEGKTLLHCITPRSQENCELLKFLVTHGLNPQQLDKEGNTLWHIGVPSFAKGVVRARLFKELIAMGVDPEKANNSGQTPLHILCSFRPIAFDPTSAYYGNGRPSNYDTPTAFDYFIGLYKDLDCTDNNGITPLHLASTFSEYLTRRLLEEGANPKKVTAEGLTALHLAARSRQANVAGLLLDWLKNTLDPATVLETVNAKDSLSRSALYYACSSGRLEIMRLLLSAGATIDTSSYDGSPWDGCVRFEEELATADWSRVAVQVNIFGALIPNAGGVLISDTTRPENMVGHNVRRLPFPIERLDEILDLLVANGSESGRRFIEQALASAVEKKFDYTVACLMRACQALDIEVTPELHEKTSLCIRRSLNARESKLGGHFNTATTHLMSLREYDLAREEIMRCGCLELSGGHPKDRTILHDLVSGGFAKLLGQVASTESVQNIDDDAFRKNNQIYRYMPALLPTACQQESSNMDVIKLLVEEKGANLNARLLPVNQRGNSTALHRLVRGNHWWQTNEALPYILGHGADTELRDEYGLTALGIALQGINGPNFNKKAVEILLEFGADPNASDYAKQTCLTLALGNVEMYELLVRHGAAVTPSTMIAVINRRDVSFLETMLVSGVDPNLRAVGKEEPTRRTADGRHSIPARHDPNSKDEFYPIEFLISSGERDPKASLEIIKLLLKHGANPSARYEKTTVMHRIIDSGENHFFRVLLKHPRVELEACDSNGMTLFLLACRHGFRTSDPARSPSLIQALLERGADIHARDNSGKNAVHYLVASSSEGCRSSSEHNGIQDLELILREAPELVNEADNQGTMPLGVAFGESPDSGVIDLLIAAEADIHGALNSKADTVLHSLFQGLWYITRGGSITVGNKDKGKRDNLFDHFLGMGADINTRNSDGETPIFAFFRKGKVSAELEPSEISNGYRKVRVANAQVVLEKEHLVWEMFDKAGVDWTAVSSKGETLLHVVAASSSNEVNFDLRRLRRFEFLLGKGLDPMREDAEYRTPLDLAAGFSFEDILGLFKA